MDGTRIGGKEWDVVIAFSSDRVSSVAGFLPPQLRRELGWREALAGAPVNGEQVLQAREVGGMRTQKNMKVLDVMKRINNALWHGMSKTLADFQCPCPLPDLEVEAVRVQHATEGAPKAWWRVTPDPMQDGGHRCELELPAALIEAVRGHSLSILTVTSDQEQVQFSAMQHLATSLEQSGQGLLLCPVSDCYHRSWNDFRWACQHSKGGLNHTVLQLTFAYNANYGPYLKAANMATKRELLQEWRELEPDAPPEWEELLLSIASDADMSSLAMSSAAAFDTYEALVLNNPTFLRKGRYTRQSAWYSIVETMHEHDAVFAARRFHLRQVARRLMASSAGARAAREAVAKELATLEAKCSEAGAELSKEQHQQQLREVRKRAGNMLLLAPSLLCNKNYFNSRLILHVAKWLWREQSSLACSKRTAEQERDHASKMARGAGERSLRQVFLDATCNVASLSRLGLQVSPGTWVPDFGATVDTDTGVVEAGVNAEEIPSLLMSFLLHIVEARGWSYAALQWSYPAAFAPLAQSPAEEGVVVAEWGRGWWTVGGGWYTNDLQTFAVREVISGLATFLTALIPQLRPFINGVSGLRGVITPSPVRAHL